MDLPQKLRRFSKNTAGADGENSTLQNTPKPKLILSLVKPVVKPDFCRL